MIQPKKVNALGDTQAYLRWLQKKATLPKTPGKQISGVMVKMPPQPNPGPKRMK